MKKFLFSTAFASLLLLYNVDALSEGIVDNNRKNHKESIDVVEGDASKQTSLYASVGNYHRIDVGGKILSYAWVADNSKDMYDHGARLDGIFNIRSVNTNPKLGISYGANLQLAVPAVKNEGFVPSVKGYNRGAQLFIDSSYGSFSFGYQEGVESVMKVDPSMIESGDNSVTWVQCIGLSDFGKRVGYHVFPGLYSESLFNERYNESYNDSSMWIKDRDFVNNLPFRISYQSPDFMGIKFGISYSPSGYDVDLFEHVLPRDYVPKGADALQRANVGNVVLPDNATFLGGAYDNVISAALSYGYSFNNNVDFQASIAGEYASDRETFKRSYLHHLHAKDLAAFAVGTSVTYGNMVFAASYGYLGSSGYLSVYDRAKGSLKNYLPGSPRDSVFKVHYPDSYCAYYLNFGVRYVYGKASVSAYYFKSNKLHYDFSNFNVGIDYDLSINNKSKGQYKVFANYHYFDVKNSVDSEVTCGNVLLLGMKYDF